MARAARDAGFEVHVATRVKDGAAAIAAEQFILHSIPFARGRLSPLASLTTISALRRVHRAVAPAVTHHVSLQPSVLGLIAALGLPTASVNALTGFGYSFASTTLKARTVKLAIGSALRLLRRYLWSLGARSCRRPAVASRRPAAIAARGGGVRPRDGGDRRSGMPRDRDRARRRCDRASGCH